MDHGAAAVAVAPQAFVEERKAPQISARTRLSTVPTPTKTRSSAAITGVVIGGLLLVVSFSSVGLHGKLAKDQLVLDKLRSDITLEERSNQTLRVEVAELQAPQRIVAEAERMGMEPSTEVVFLQSATAPVVAESDQTAPTIPSLAAAR